MRYLSLFSIMLALLVTIDAAERFTFDRQLMGTKFSVVCYADNREIAAQVAEVAFAQAAAIDQAASDYLPTSELSQLTAQPIGKAITLSPLLYDLLQHSRRLAEATNGSFDPTLGPLTKLWREARAHKTLPTPEKIQAARLSTGWQHFTLDPASRSITLHRSGMAFDLGGVAKGYAADLMLEKFTAAGISQVLIAAGGDIRLGEAPPGVAGWRVAVQSFDPTGCDEVLVLANAAVSTSGDLHQSLDIAGVRYSHILDPATGLGLIQRTSACVITNEAKLSDALATAACVHPEISDRLRIMPGVHSVKIRSLPATLSGPREQSNQP